MRYSGAAFLLERTMARRNRRNSSRYWWDGEVPGLSLLEADFTTHEYPPHMHEALVVAVTEDGGSKIKSRGTIEQATASTLFVFNPMETHAGWMGRSERWRYRAFYLTKTAIDAVAAMLGRQTVPYFTRNLIDDTQLITAFLALHRVIAEAGDRFETSELLVGAFGQLFARHGSGDRAIARGPRDRNLLLGICRRMQGEYGRELSLKELSRAAGLTQFQLIGLFKRGLGVTPHAYLTHLRLCAACRDLRRGAPIARTALESGFYDQSALTKSFKRWYGITPLQFASAAKLPGASAGH
ncbi:transcriptional regulator, AraC family [Rhizobiales bacterium GAS191]|nr:transcriptional regulator, AraC family [Rhizobiales bacterium GAS113]SEC20973.1 transcriptional regulator, AraC family [Rhizobiales bacterium GAS191]